MEWNKPYHSESDKSRTHGKSFGSEVTRDLPKKEVKEVEADEVDDALANLDFDD